MLRKVVYIVLGTICLVFGIAAFVIPLLPSFPFLLLTLILYSKSSDRLYQWFIGTQMYKQNLESYLNGDGLTTGSKVRIMLTITLFMLIGAFFSRNNTIVLTILALIWSFHVVLFTFKIKTKVEENNDLVVDE